MPIVVIQFSDFSVRAVSGRIYITLHSVMYGSCIFKHLSKDW